jgi:hypothetical protein
VYLSLDGELKKIGYANMTRINNNVKILSFLSFYFMVIVSGLVLLNIK